MLEGESNRPESLLQLLLEALVLVEWSVRSVSVQTFLPSHRARQVHINR